MAKHARYSHAGGPDYPTLGATVAKWRWRACEGLQSLAREERQAYGAAVERAILALQRAEANCGLPPISPKVHCASGMPHNTGGAIHNAIREQQARALAAYALANKGHDTRALQAYLSHRNIQHTVRYTELSQTRFKDFWRR